MRSFLSRLFILFAVIGLIAVPVLLSADAELRRGEAALAAGRSRDAAADFEHAARILFWRVDLWERAGRAAFAGGDFEQAIRLLESSPTLSVDGWKELGEAYYQLDRFEESANAYQRGLKIHGPSAPLYRGLALAFNAQKDLESEASALQNYVALMDTEAAAYYRLGMLLSIFDPDHALTELKAASKLNADYDPAVETMRSTLNLASLEKDDAHRLVVIGRGLGLVQEWPLAREAFQRAAAADAKYAEAWAWLGEAKQHLGQGGLDELKRAETLDPFSANIRALFGLYWKRAEEPMQALAEFQWAVIIDPQNPAFQAALGDAYVQTSNLPPALAAYQRATELAPKDATYWRLLAGFCAQYTYQVAEVGVPAAQKVLMLIPEEAASYDLLGWMYLMANVPDLAEGNFLRALSLDPYFAPAHLHLGELYLQLGKMDSAREHLVQAQTLDPQGEDGALAAHLLSQYFP